MNKLINKYLKIIGQSVQTVPVLFFVRTLHDNKKLNSIEHAIYAIARARGATHSLLHIWQNVVAN